MRSHPTLYRMPLECSKSAVVICSNHMVVRSFPDNHIVMAATQTECKHAEVVPDTHPDIGTPVEGTWLEDRPLPAVPSWLTDPTFDTVVDGDCAWESIGASTAASDRESEDSMLQRIKSPELLSYENRHRLLHKLARKLGRNRLLRGVDQSRAVLKSEMDACQEQILRCLLAFDEANCAASEELHSCCATGDGGSSSSGNPTASAAVMESKPLNTKLSPDGGSSSAGNPTASAAVIDGKPLNTKLSPDGGSTEVSAAVMDSKGLQPETVKIALHKGLRLVRRRQHAVRLTPSRHARKDRCTPDQLASHFKSFILAGVTAQNSLAAEATKSIGGLFRNSKREKGDWMLGRGSDDARAAGSGGEMLSVHAGGCGVRMGSAFWTRLCTEHDVNADGCCPTESYHGKNSRWKEFGRKKWLTETSDGHWKPRALFIDMEPSVLDEIRLGSHRQLYHPHSLCSGKEDALSFTDAENRWRRSYGESAASVAHHHLRRLVEAADCPAGLVATTAVGGCTGGAILAGQLQTLAEQFRNSGAGSATKGFPVGLFTLHPSPSGLGSSPIEPYNTLLSVTSLDEVSDWSAVVDNDALFSGTVGTDCFSYANDRVARLMAAISRPSRFYCRESGHGPGMDLRQLTTNILPYPHLNMLLPSCVTSILSSTESLSQTPGALRAWQLSQRLWSREALLSTVGRGAQKMTKANPDRIRPKSVCAASATVYTSDHLDGATCARAATRVSWESCLDSPVFVPRGAAGHRCFSTAVVHPPCGNPQSDEAALLKNSTEITSGGHVSISV
eukprot:SAG31_NODE_1265_length_9070_cov_5.167205_3_plen_788_part_00